MANVQRIANWLCMALLFLALSLTLRDGMDAWITPDQQASKLMSRGDPARAAEVFADPFLKGVALFRGGDFKTAAQTFAGIPGADSLFNQANARVMLGEYDRAIELYQQVLESDSGRKDAMVNLEIAIGRAERVRDEGGRMTGGMLGADEIVFDAASNNSSSQDAEEVEGKDLGDEELRGLWLREVQTTPSDFLKAKFNFQNSRKDKSKTSGGNRSESKK